MDQELDRPVTAVPLVVRIRRRIDAMMAQGQELLHTFRRLFESTISSRMTMIFVVEGMRRRTDVGTAGRLLGKFRRQKMLAVVTGLVGLALILILLLEISLRIQLANEAKDAGTDATLVASASPPKTEFNGAFPVQSIGPLLLQSAEQLRAPEAAPSSEFTQTFGQVSREPVPLPGSRKSH